MNAYSYICTSGHVDPAPSMGTYGACQVLLPVAYNGSERGAVPCGCAVVREPYDPALEAAYRLGGREAVLDVIRLRVGRSGLDASQVAAALSR